MTVDKSGISHFTSTSRAHTNELSMGTSDLRESGDEFAFEDFHGGVAGKCIEDFKLLGSLLDHQSLFPTEVLDLLQAHGRGTLSKFEHRAHSFTPRQATQSRLPLRQTGG
jgi:hypothetical protein